MTPNLITRWFLLQSQRGLNKSDAVRNYNRTHGTAYSYHRFREYEVGDRPTPHDVAQNMRRDVLPGLVAEYTGKHIPVWLRGEFLAEISPPPIKSTIAQ